MLAGNISPEDAGELYAYTYHAAGDVHGRIDDYRRTKVRDEPNAKEETVKAVKTQYPQVDERTANHIALLRDEAAEYRERAKKRESQNDENYVKHLMSEADRVEKNESYAIRAFEHSRKGKKT